MISIALMLLLMIGINLVFRMTGQAVGAGQALSEQTRSAQGAQSVMFRDLGNAAVSDGPCILIRSKIQPAFKDKTDYLTATDQTEPRIDPDLAPDGTATPLNVFLYNSRIHRQDVISFFAHDLFNRQTGNDGTYVADQSSNEAWVWYGHLNICDNGGVFNGNATIPLSTMPGTPYPVPAGTNPLTVNPNNYFATQWILGRVAMLLQEPSGPAGARTIKDGAGTAQAYIQSAQDASGTGWTAIWPLAYDAPSGGAVSTSAWLRSGRYDLAGTSISGFRQILNTLLQTTPPYNWYDAMMLRDDRVGVVNFDGRFYGKPFVNRPIQSADVAGQSPIFLPACTQFFVEYAGDFLKQDPANNGTVTDWYWSATGSTDGEIDYYYDSTTKTKKIRWYGLPRDTTGDGHIVANNGDVVPLMTVAASGGAAAPAPFEKTTTSGNTIGVIPQSPPNNDYTSYSPAAGTWPLPDYTCAWGPKDTHRPSMIRIMMVLDDPTGRLKEGQSFEFVFKLQ